MASSSFARLPSLLETIGYLLLVLVTLDSVPAVCWAWSGQGHKIVAYIAADHLTPVARRHVAQILGVADDPPRVAEAMAQAAVRPDAEFRNSAPETLPWHYINICRQDMPADEPARCRGGSCLTAKIDQFVDDLRFGKKDPKWNSAAQLAFIINFMGEIHQPFHAITNADKSGQCVGVSSPEPASTLHSLWGETLVYHLEHELGTRGAAETATALEKRFPNRITKLPTTPKIAWESHQLAERDGYEVLGIREQPCQPTACIHLSEPVRVGQAYLDREWMVVGRQLATGGYRLAALLNSVWSN